LSIFSLSPSAQPTPSSNMTEPIIIDHCFFCRKGLRPYII
jgi:hypothetical protein